MAGARRHDIEGLRALPDGFVFDVVLDIDDGLDIACISGRSSCLLRSARSGAPRLRGWLHDIPP